MNDESCPVLRPPKKKTRTDPIFHRPLIPLLIAFMVGIGAGKGWDIPPWFFYLFLCCGTVLLVLTLVFKKPRIHSVMLLAAGLGGWWIHGACHPRLPVNHISHYSTGDKVTLTGTIMGNPAITHRRSRIIIDVADMEQEETHVPVTGQIRLTVMGRLENVVSGDRLTVRTRLRPFRNFGNPGAFDYKQYMMFNGIWASAFAPVKHIRVLDSPSNPTRGHRIDRLRHHIDAVIAGHGGDADAKAVLQALLTGNRASISPSLRDTFNRAGAGHLLAISGLHMGIVATVSFMMFRWMLSFFPALLWRAWTQKGAGCLTMLPVLGYGLISGMSPSTERAMIMVCVFLLSIVMERDQDILNTLALAAAIILIRSPEALFSISFQMSFMAVLWIVLGLQAVDGLIKNTPDRSPWPLVRKSVVFILVSFFAILGTLPLTMVYFNQVSFIGLIANLVLIPLVGFIAVPLGLLSLFVMPVLPVVSDLMIGLDLAIIDLSLTIIHLIASLPFSAVTTITPDGVMIVCYYLTLFSTLFWVYQRGRAPKDLSRTDFSVIGPKTNKLIFYTTLTILCCHAGLLLKNRYFNPDLSIIAMDVGQGSATLVRFPKGKTMLVDGGGFSDNSVFDVGRNIVAPFLLRNHIRTLDMMVLTHPEADHVNGLTYILNHFTVKNLIITGQTKDTYGYKKFQQAIDQAGIPVTPFSAVNRHWTIRGVHMDILYPPSDISSLAAIDAWRSANNTSIVIRLVFDEMSFLLPGDIMAQAEQELVDTWGHTLHSNVLFVPHHGSNTSTSWPFINAVAPNIAVISLGWKNRFHFPSSQVIRRLDQQGAQIYRTDINGAIQLITDGATLHVRPTLPADRALCPNSRSGRK